MKVEELIDILSRMPKDAEVRMAHQPSYPLQYNVQGVAEESAIKWTEDDEAEAEADEEEYNADIRHAPVSAVVWIVEGGHPDSDEPRSNPYLPKQVWDAARRYSHHPSRRRGCACTIWWFESTVESRPTGHRAGGQGREKQMGQTEYDAAARAYDAAALSAANATAAAAANATAAGAAAAAYAAYAAAAAALAAAAAAMMA